MTNVLNKLTNELFVAKNQKAEHNTAVKKLNVEIKRIERDLLHEMGDLKTVSNDQGTVYVSKQVLPNVVNWDLFYKHIQEHGAFYMLERRPTKKAFEEQYEQGLEVPGVEPVVFNEVRTRKS